MTDVLAERAHKIGGTTLRSIGDIARQHRIAGNDAVYVETDDMLAELRDDNQRFVTSMREARDACNEHRDVAAMSFLENYIDDTEKRAWLLYEISRQDKPSRH
jgi:starvation-inducible DNA-binding protein